MLEEVGSYTWAHSNSLIKNVTQFSNVVYYCKQPEDSFIKMTSRKIDFYFEVFKQMQNHVLSYLRGAT